MEESAKETVIIVHGTWAAPKAGKDQWYQPADGVPTGGFIAKLNAALHKRGSVAQCWAHCSQANQVFQWSGENSWIARTRAAAALGDYVTKLRKEGWRCHIVAHSHGGNVLVEALPQITAPLESSVQIGKIVTLGSPFLDVMTPILGQELRRQRNLIGVSFMLFVVMLLGTLRAIWRGSLLPSESIVPFVMIMLLFTGVALRWKKLRADKDRSPLYRSAFRKFIVIEITVWFLAGAIFHYMVFPPVDLLKVIICCSVIVILVIVRHHLHRTNRTLVIPYHYDGFRISPRFLALGSRRDEAWQLLHHIRSSDNPLAVKTKLIAYLVSNLRSTFAQKTARDHIYFGSFRDIGRAAVLGAMFIYFLLLAVLLIIYEIIVQTSSTLNLRWVLASSLWSLGVILIAPLLFGYKAFVAFMLPLRWCFRLLWSCTSVFPALVTYGVRKASWTVFLKIAMGLEGYRFKVPIIERSPSLIGEKFVKYEDMPLGAERRAIKKRSAWIERHIEDVSETFSKMMVTAADISSLQHTIETDQSLVHAAYYTDDECIARIADWIAFEDDLRAHASHVANA